MGKLEKFSAETFPRAIRLCHAAGSVRLGCAHVVVAFVVHVRENAGVVRGEGRAPLGGYGRRKGAIAARRTGGCALTPQEGEAPSPAHGAALSRTNDDDERTDADDVRDARSS